MGITNKVCDFFEFWYYQYILCTALYMLESWERAVFSILRSGSKDTLLCTYMSSI